MSYEARIIEAITELGERNGSSSIAIKKHLQSEMEDETLHNTLYLKALKDGLASGVFVEENGSFKLGPAARARLPLLRQLKPDPDAKGHPIKKITTTKKTVAKKKATKKTVAKKKTAPKKKATTTKKKKTTTKKMLRRLGSPEKVYDMEMDLPAVQNPPMLQGSGMIAGVRHPINTSSQLSRGMLGIATTAAVGLYLYKKRRPTKIMKHTVPDPMEIV